MHRALVSLCLFFLFLFLLISTVPLTIPVTYKGTQFRRAELFQSLSRATLCPVYRAYSYAVHRCIHRPGHPIHRPFPLFPNPGPSLFHFRHSQRSALNSLSTMRLSRVVDAQPSTVVAAQRGLCECSACMPRALRTRLRARCVCFPHENAIDGCLFVDASDTVCAVSIILVSASIVARSIRSLNQRRRWLVLISIRHESPRMRLERWRGVAFVEISSDESFSPRRNRNQRKCISPLFSTHLTSII